MRGRIPALSPPKVTRTPKTLIVKRKRIATLAEVSLLDQTGGDSKSEKGPLLPKARLCAESLLSSPSAFAWPGKDAIEFFQ